MSVASRAIFSVHTQWPGFLVAQGKDVFNTFWDNAHIWKFVWYFEVPVKGIKPVFVCYGLLLTHVVSMLYACSSRICCLVYNLRKCVLIFSMARFPLLLSFLSPFFFLAPITLGSGASDSLYCRWHRIE